MTWGQGGYGPPPEGPPGVPPTAPGQAPGGYGPPPTAGAYGPGGMTPMASKGLALQNPAALTPRNSALVVALSVLTCGIYYFFWIYKLSDELLNATADPEVKPGTDILFTLVTCGLWGMYVQYRNMQKYLLISPRPHTGTDPSQIVLILHLASFVVGGITSLIAMYMVQEEANRVAQLGQGGPGY